MKEPNVIGVDALRGLVGRRIERVVCFYGSVSFGLDSDRGGGFIQALNEFTYWSASGHQMHTIQVPPDRPDSTCFSAFGRTISDISLSVDGAELTVRLDNGDEILLTPGAQSDGVIVLLDGRVYRS